MSFHQPGKPKVVFADDEASLRQLVAATIESDEYDLIEARDGDEAWRLINKHRPHVVLLDIQMPGLSGLQLTEAIRATPELAKTRIILLTAKAQQSDIDIGLDAGADLYLAKPFSPLELLTAVEQALGVNL